MQTTGSRPHIRVAAVLSFTFVLVAGCAPSPDQRVAYAPVLQACLGSTRQRILEIPERSDYAARLIEFDVALSTHPALAGFVEVASGSVDEDRLARLTGGLTADCDRSMSASYRKDSPGDALALFEFLTRITDRSVFYNDGGRGGPVDPAQVYLVDSGENVKVFFRVNYE